ncbi:MAG: hypothetical protein EBZ77_08735, partial [Chitinophagia bacterium]|nr:hypothetical protein [Chitinophagia bacterium]
MELAWGGKVLLKVLTMKRNCAFLFISFYLLSGTVFAIKPKADYINTPKDFGIPYVETTIKSDAATLLTWYLAQPEKATAPTMIMCNADYGNMSYQLRTAAALYGLGYNVVLFDYRGFGHSSPFAIDTNQLYYNEFVSDFFTVCSYYYAQSKRPLLVYGQSMGTIVATLGLAKSAELKDSKFIYESFIEDLTHTTAVLKQMKNRTFTLPPNYTEYNNAVHSLKN